MAEIISRRPPFSEIKAMSIDHIVKAVGHLRDAVFSYGEIKMKSLDSHKKLQTMQQSIIIFVTEVLY